MSTLKNRQSLNPVKTINRDPLKVTNTRRMWRIKKLNCYAEVHSLLAKGTHIETVARFVQKERHELTELSPLTVMKLLRAYRKSIPKTEIIAKAVVKKGVPLATNGKFLDRLRKEAQTQIDVLSEFSKLYDIQMNRINRAVEQEETIGLNLNNLEISIKTAQGLLDSIHQVQSDLGITPKNLGTMGIEANVMQGVVHKLQDGSVQKVLENPTSRHKVLSVTQRILALASESNPSAAILNSIENVFKSNDIYENEVLDSTPIIEGTPNEIMVTSP